MALMYKAYLYDRKVNKPKEIRRFSVDHDVSSSYEYLRKKVASVFPDLSEENFNLQWHDSEGDLIWFNSDEELIEALSEHQGGLFKLMIQEKSNGTDNTDDTKDESDEGGYKNCGRGRGKWWGKRGPRGGGYWCGYPGFQQQMFNQMFGQQPQQGCPKKDNGNNSKEEGNGTSNDGHQSFPSGEEYLKNVGSAVSDFLKPFGIDVDVSVDHNGIRTSCSTNPQKEGRDKPKDDEEQPTCSKNADKKPASGDQQDEEKTPPPSSPFPIPVKVVHEKKMKKENNLKQEKAGNQSSSDEGEWTLVKDEDSKLASSPSSEEKKEKEEGSSNKNKDSNGGSSDRPRQPGPLDLLLAMGFKDENGSLARLLQACQNDIGKVLENMEKMNVKM